jgi:hypothetical protein
MDEAVNKQLYFSFLLSAVSSLRTIPDKTAPHFVQSDSSAKDVVNLF